MNQKTIERIRKFTEDRDWEQYHTPTNLAKSISIEAAELLECFQWSDTDFDLDHVKEELADVLVYCRNMLDCLELDEDEIIMSKMAQNEAKYPVEKARGSAAKYDQLPGNDRMTEEECLRKIEDLNSYSLSNDEYNMALMLLFSIKDGPKQSAEYMIWLMMTEEENRAKGHSEKASESWVNYYKNVRRMFTSSLNTERRSAGSNETAEVASYAGKLSAAAFLLRFRANEEKAAERYVLGGAPNLGDVRRVDYRKVADEPGEQYLRYWKDFIDEEP